MHDQQYQGWGLDEVLVQINNPSTLHALHRRQLFFSDRSYLIFII